jgi:integrase
MAGKSFQRSTGETSRAKAEALAWRAFEAERLRSRGEEPDIPLGDLGALWVELNRGVKSDAYVDSVDRFVRCGLGDLAGFRVAELTTEAVERQRGAYMRSGHAQSSADTWLAHLKLLAGWAVKRRAVLRIPFEVKKLGHQKRPRTILPVADRHAWTTVVEQVSAGEPAVAMVIRFMLEMGLRETEAIGARWEWLDRTRKTYTPGKTKGKEAWPRPVPDGLLARLGEGRAGMIAGRSDGKPVSVGQIDRVMRKANQAFGLSGLTPHGLRRTYATHLNDQGVPTEDIRKALGHKSIHTTTGYIHSNLERVRQAQKSFEDPAVSTVDKSGARPHVNPHEHESRKF